MFSSSLHIAICRLPFFYDHCYCTTCFSPYSIQPCQWKISLQWSSCRIYDPFSPQILNQCRFFSRICLSYFNVKAYRLMAMHHKLEIYHKTMWIQSLPIPITYRFITNNLLSDAESFWRISSSLNWSVISCCCGATWFSRLPLYPIRNQMNPDNTLTPRLSPSLLILQSMSRIGLPSDLFLWTCQRRAKHKCWNFSRSLHSELICLKIW
jgi:hypothetical protein